MQGDYHDSNRPAPRWHHTMAVYHNRTQEKEFFGSQLYMFGGASATYGAMDSSWFVEPGQVRGFKDLWIYHA